MLKYQVKIFSEFLIEIGRQNIGQIEININQLSLSAAGSGYASFLRFIDVVTLMQDNRMSCEYDLGLVLDWNRSGVTFL